MAHKNILTLGAVMVALVAVVGVSIASYAASDNNAEQNKMGPWQNSAEWQERHQLMQEKREAIESALANGDYNAWLEAVGSDSLQAQEITAEEFPRLIDAYNLEKEAREKMEQARQIREELGLSFPGGRMGERMGGFYKNCKQGFPPLQNTDSLAN